MTNVEYQIIYYIQRADDILVMLLPWVKWLTIVGFSALVLLLQRWKVKR